MAVRTQQRVDLRSQRALVTGAGRRVGAAIARALGAQGMRVAVHYHHSREGAEATAEAIEVAGGEATLLQADLHDRGAARRLVDRASEALGGLELVVPSAANFDRVPYEALDDGWWDRALELNLDAPFAICHQASGALRASGGAIVLITCTSATVPYRHYLPYVVSKGAVRQLMRALSLELAPEVRVNAVAPGTVLPPPDMDEHTRAQLRSRIPLQRLGEAEDVAEAVLYLARSPFVTGQELVVDGGRSVAAVPPRHGGEQA